MRLLVSMHLLNDVMSAVTPTSTHVHYVALWLLLLLAKTMLFLFLKALSVDITFIKKVWTPTIGEILVLA